MKFETNTSLVYLHQAWGMHWNLMGVNEINPKFQVKFMKYFLNFFIKNNFKIIVICVKMNFIKVSMKKQKWISVFKKQTLVLKI